MEKSLKEFIGKYDWNLYNRLNGWVIETDGDLVKLHMPARDGQYYIVLFECVNYPFQAPSVVFVNNQGLKTDPGAWPKGDDVFHSEIKLPPNCFICIPITREGLQNHPEWTRNPSVDPWNTEKHSLMTIINHLDNLLQSSNYLGRNS